MNETDKAMSFYNKWGKTLMKYIAGSGCTTEEAMAAFKDINLKPNFSVTTE